MKLGIIIYSSDPETVWSILRLANGAMMSGDKVEIFLLAKGVELESMDRGNFKIKEQALAFKKQGGKITACSTCLAHRNMAGSDLYEKSKGMECLDLVKECDKVITI